MIRLTISRYSSTDITASLSVIFLAELLPFKRMEGLPICELEIRLASILVSFIFSGLFEIVKLRLMFCDILVGFSNL